VTKTKTMEGIEEEKEEEEKVEVKGETNVEES